MTTHLPFILSEEIERLENSNSYEAYILKCKIDNIIQERKEKAEIKDSICCGNAFKYFDSQLMKEDEITVHSINDLEVSGERKSDRSLVIIPIEAISLSKNPNQANQIRNKINDIWNLQHFERIVVRSGYNYLLGYYIKFNHGGTIVKLLGGDVTKVGRFNNFFEPTESDLESFYFFENDKNHIDREYNKTVTAVSNKLKSMDVKNYNKLLRYLLIRGFEKMNIDKALNEIGSVTSLSEP